MHRILLMGPQGSGKGTQAKLLSEKLAIPAFAMGQLLRDEIAAHTELGQKVESIMNAGNLVSDQDAADVLKARLSKPDTANGFVLDGYPRNAAQYAVAGFVEPTHVIVIDIPREESLKRLGGRLTCDTCGSVFSTADGHKEGEACACGGTLMTRDDDTPEAIGKRLDIYTNDTEPIIKEYGDLVHRIDGLGGVEDIQKRILEVLN